MMTIKTVIQKLIQLRETNKSQDLVNDINYLKTLQSEPFKILMIEKYNLKN